MANRVILVTAAFRGLDLALAEQLAAGGESLASCARDPGELGTAAQWTGHTKGEVQ